MMKYKSPKTGIGLVLIVLVTFISIGGFWFEKLREDVPVLIPEEGEMMSPAGDNTNNLLNTLTTRYRLPPGLLKGLYAAESGSGTSTSTGTSGEIGSFQLTQDVIDTYSQGLDANTFEGGAEIAARYLADIQKDKSSMLSSNPSVKAYQLQVAYNRGPGNTPSESLVNGIISGTLSPLDAYYGSDLIQGSTGPTSIETRHNNFVEAASIDVGTEGYDLETVRTYFNKMVTSETGRNYLRTNYRSLTDQDITAIISAANNPFSPIDAYTAYLRLEKGEYSTAAGSMGGLAACFLPSTKITLSNNSKTKIKDIKPGDNVLSFNLESNQPVNSTVLNTFSHEENNYLILNNNIKVTEYHVVYAKLK